ncbi:MAG: carbon-nitrogen hydrolase family protein [Oscillospiraceae bacterium]|nr:carbon-nitrogen hydrolase family protein [Oscillospiraceae bacterium]
MKDRLKLAVLQLRTELSRDETMKKAARMLREAAEQGAEMAVLPEMFNCPYAGKYFREAAALGHEDSVAALSALAKETGLWIVGGSVPEREGDKLYNTCFVFDSEGRIAARHRKVHLFDIDAPGMRFRESDTFSPGREITVFDTPWGKMGAAICFDVRFPELFRAMAKRGARLILLPAQFNMTTGPVHWESTLRTRAVDNEVFLAACSAARYVGFSYECWGHSLVSDPWGTLLAAADETEQILYADLDFARVDEVRRQLPTFLHLREDVYEVAK